MKPQDDDNQLRWPKLDSRLVGPPNFVMFCLGKRETRFAEITSVPNCLTTLNPPQLDAVAFGLTAKDVAIIHGPPGTGKTTTLAELIYQAVQNGSSVLACAPSNTAVDNLLEKLVALMPAVVRVGHPARVFESLRGHTLDELVDSDPSTDVSPGYATRSQRVDSYR